MRKAPDPYFPGHGDHRYTVEHHDLTLRYKVSTNRLDGRAVLRVRALTDLADLRLDLHGLQVHGVLVDGRRPRRHDHRLGALTVRLATPLAAGASAVVDIAYSGKPRPVPGPFGPAGWEELDDGVLVASQPYGAPSWFPCNDHAGDKATYRFDVTAEAAYVVVANGVLIERRPQGGAVRWVYAEERPMAPYLAALHVGRYAVTPLSTGRPPVDLVAPPALDAAGTPFDRVPAMIAQLVEWFGPYPFAEYRCVVTPDVLEIPLEAQGLASFGRNHRADTWENERLVVHELSHQWFGNSVTAPLGSDIWLHEGFACYTEWFWSEARGLDTADAWARHHHAVLAANPVPWPLADPGVANMFDDEVYKRGALTLHALGRVLGRDALLALLRDWCAEHRDGLVTTADFERFAQARTSVDLVPFFHAWVHTAALPPLPA